VTILEAVRAEERRLVKHLSKLQGDLLPLAKPVNYYFLYRWGKRSSGSNPTSSRWWDSVG